MQKWRSPAAVEHDDADVGVTTHVDEGVDELALHRTVERVAGFRSVEDEAQHACIQLAEQLGVLVAHRFPPGYFGSPSPAPITSRWMSLVPPPMRCQHGQEQALAEVSVHRDVGLRGHQFAGWPEDLRARRAAT